MSLNPQTSPLASGKIKMTWTPDPAVFGYRIYRDGVPVSKSSNALQDETTFGVETDGRSHAYGIGSALMPATREDSVYPPIPPAQLGALLFAKYPEPAKPTGPVLKVNSFDEWKNAWTNPQEGADYDGQGKTFSGTGTYVCRIKGQKTTRFRNATVQGGANFLTAGSHIQIGNTMKEPVTFRKATVDGLKVDTGSSWISWDGLILEDNGVQGVLIGAGTGATVTDIRGVNFITRRNGKNANKDHGLYAANVLRFLLANWVSDTNQAYCGQLYPEAREGDIVNATGYGSVVRGGYIFGSESSNPNPTRMIRNIGCMSTFAPYSPGWDAYRTAPGCTVEDSQAWANAGPDVIGLTPTNVLHADPLFVDAAAGDFRPRHSVIVRDVNRGWLMPTDLYGNPRGPHAGALALAA